MIYRLMYNGELKLCETTNKQILAAAIIDYTEKNGGTYANFIIRVYDTEEALIRNMADKVYSLDGWATLQTFDLQANA